MVKLLLSCFRVTNSMVNFHFLTFELRKYGKYQTTFEITDLKTEKKTKCWSRIIVIRDFFIEMKYYTIQNIWKEIGKLNFVIIDVDLALKRYPLGS